MNHWLCEPQQRHDPRQTAAYKPLGINVLGFCSDGLCLAVFFALPLPIPRSYNRALFLRAYLLRLSEAPVPAGRSKPSKPSRSLLRGAPLVPLLRAWAGFPLRWSSAPLVCRCPRFAGIRPCTCVADITESAALLVPHGEKNPTHPYPSLLREHAVGAEALLISSYVIVAITEGMKESTWPQCVSASTKQPG